MLNRRHKNYSGAPAKILNLGSAFSLAELILVMAIIGIVSAVSFSSYGGYKKIKALDIAMDRLVSVVERARIETLTAEDNTFFGVKFENNKATLYKTYFDTNSTSSEVYLFDSGVFSSSISLKAAGVSTTSVYFAKFNGIASATGTILIQAVGDPSLQKTVTIYANGLIDSD